MNNRKGVRDDFGLSIERILVVILVHTLQQVCITAFWQLNFLVQHAQNTSGFLGKEDRELENDDSNWNLFNQIERWKVVDISDRVHAYSITLVLVDLIDEDKLVEVF